MTAKSSTRRNLAELKTLYMIRPHFRDVVVEGRDDVAWLKWYFSENPVEHVMVFAVDDRVNIPRELPIRVGEDVNARGRVVALAAEFEEWNLSENNLTCIADADYDIFSDPVSPKCLLKTDYAAMEVYSLADRPLSKFLINSAKSDIQAAEIKSLLKPAWAVLYTVRYVLHSHSDGLSLAEKFANKCINNSGQIVADAHTLLKSASPSPTGEFLEALLEHHSRYIKMLPDDPLQGIRGHDIAPLLARFLNLRNNLANAETVEGLLRQSIELRDLEDFSLFRSLYSRVSS